MARSESTLPTLLIVDGDAAARKRLRGQLRAIHPSIALRTISEAADGSAALALALAGDPRIDIVLLSLSLPDCSGLDLARKLAESPAAPQIVLIAPSADLAAQGEAQDLADCLPLPVRTERLAQALAKAVERLAADASAGNSSAFSWPGESGDYLTVTDRLETRAIPITDVVYLRAELKYVTIRTRDREFLTQQTLAELMQAYPGQFVRVHRNALAARDAIAGARRTAVDEGQPDAEPYWEVILHGVPERLAVSRRQWRDVREIVERLAPGSTMADASRPFTHRIS